MTDELTTLLQARISEGDARQVDHDLDTLGLKNRSEAVREGLRLLHRQAVRHELSRQYAEYYGNAQAPVSDISAQGAEIAAETMTPAEDE